MTLVLLEINVSLVQWTIDEVRSVLDLTDLILGKSHQGPYARLPRVSSDRGLGHEKIC